MIGPLLNYHRSDNEVNTSVIHASDAIEGMEEIPERLKRLRKAAGLTQAALARAAGVVQSTIGNIEGGHRGYGESLVDIAKVLRVPPEYLRCETDDYAVVLMTEPPMTMSALGAPVSVSISTLALLGAAIEKSATEDRSGIVKLMTAFIENPSANADLLPLIEKRLSGELHAPQKVASGGSK
ncbi:helix-turn-helix domain-containing protein [Variovorax sp. H27-G14]|uniref:helix-turn-helix domain-containing protein n=1 Tax=Variovorax sp. H27-G14 TaxID=3111914 RepID=UPI0038FD18F6